MPNIEFLKEVEESITGFWLTDLSLFSALVYHSLPNLNWAGFYLSDNQVLRLGPFVGRPACTEIAFTRGVCGAAYTGQQTMIVDDVLEFPGHISCDSASRSELVLPFKVDGVLLGVFDLDSPKLARFTVKDAQLLENALAILGKINPLLTRRPYA